MARALRIVYPGAVYPVMNRGASRQAVFSDSVDYERLLQLLGDGHARWGGDFGLLSDGEPVTFVSSHARGESCAGHAPCARRVHATSQSGARAERAPCFGGLYKVLGRGSRHVSCRRDPLYSLESGPGEAGEDPRGLSVEQSCRVPACQEFPAMAKHKACLGRVWQRTGLP